MYWIWLITFQYLKGCSMSSQYCLPTCTHSEYWDMLIWWTAFFLFFCIECIFRLLKQTVYEQLNIIMIFFPSNTRWTIIATPGNSYEWNISEVYSHSYSQFWALQGDYEHEITQPWLPVSQKYNRRENKAQIPLIIHHNEKKNKEYIYDVQQKIIELHKLVKWL